MFDTDVFVWGGGPAGLSAAIAARAAGFRVMLADAEKPPIDKACGEGLMPNTVRAAAQLGVVIEPEHGRVFRGIRFHGEGGRDCVASDFPNGTGIGVRRPLLQRLFITRAEAAGVELHWGQRVKWINEETVAVGAETVRARWMIGADGSQSSVRRRAGLQRFRREEQRFSYRRHFRVAPWSEYMEIHWGEQSQFYITPVGPDQVCLALMSRDPQLRIEDALTQFPFLARRVAGCEATGLERGAAAATRRLRRVTKGNVALVGDASGTVDPITGEGMYLAFEQARALAKAFSEEDLSLYERAHAEIGRRARFMSDFMLLMDRSKLLQRRALRSFEAKPHLFSNLLAMHVGQLSAMRTVRTMAALSWQVAAGQVGGSVIRSGNI